MLGLNPQNYTCLNSLISVVEGCVYDLLNNIISAHTISLLLKSTVGNWFAASSRLCCWILCSWITRENPLSSICSIECCFLYYLLPESVFSRGNTQQRYEIFRISIRSNPISVTLLIFVDRASFQASKLYFLFLVRSGSTWVYPNSGSKSTVFIRPSHSNQCSETSAEA